MFKDLLKKRRPLHIPGDAELRNLTSVNPGLAALYLEEAMGMKHPTWPLHVAHWTALAAFFACAWGISYVSSFPYAYFGPFALAAFLLLCWSYSQVPFRQGLRRPSLTVILAVVSLSAYVAAFLLAYASMADALSAEKKAYLSAFAETEAPVLLSARGPVLIGELFAYSYSAPDGRHFGIWRSGHSDCRLKSLSVRYAVAKPGIHESFAASGDCALSETAVP